MYRVLISIFLPLVVSNNVTVPEKNKTEDKDALRVVNGEVATAGQFPYQVSLKQLTDTTDGKEYMNLCGGALIKPSWVLTAAHCMEKDGNSCEQCCKKAQFYDPEKYQAVAGSLKNFQKFEEDGQWRGIAKFVVPGDYWFPKKDLAVAHTKKPFVLNDNVKVIPFAATYKDYGAVECKFAGFGKIRYTTQAEFPVELMWANLVLVPAKACSKLHGANMHDFICTRTGKTNVLQGDSGGALVCTNTGDKNDKGQGVIVGIESGATPRKNFFTRASSFSSFIATGESCEASCPESYIVLLSIIVSSVYESAFTI